MFIIAPPVGAINTWLVDTLKNMDPNARIFLGIALRWPYTVENLPGAQRTSGLGDQRLHQFKFLDGKAYRIFTFQLKTFRAEGQIAVRKRRGKVLAAAPCQRTNPGQQLLHGEGFGQVVVGAGVQAGNAVIHLGPGGQHQNRRHDIHGTKVLQYLNSVFFRHHDIEDNNIVAVLCNMFRCLFPVVDGINVVSLMGEHGAQGAAQVTGILSEQ